MSVVFEKSPEKLLFWGNVCLIAAPVMYAPAVTFPKIAILAVFLRIFIDKPSRMICYIMIVVTVITCVINISLSIWQCSPPAYAWNKKIAGGRCDVDVEAHLRYGSVPNIVTDVVMLILPLPLIWTLRTSARIKWGLTVTFATGSL